MLRWLLALLVLCMITLLLASGIIPFKHIGVAKTLFGFFGLLLTVSLVIGLLRGR